MKASPPSPGEHDPLEVAQVAQELSKGTPRSKDKLMKMPKSFSSGVIGSETQRDQTADSVTAPLLSKGVSSDRVNDQISNRILIKEMAIELCRSPSAELTKGPVQVKMTRERETSDEQASVVPQDVEPQHDTHREDPLSSSKQQEAQQVEVLGYWMAATHSVSASSDPPCHLTATQCILV